MAFGILAQMMTLNHLSLTLQHQNPAITHKQKGSRKLNEYEFKIPTLLTYSCEFSSNHGFF